MENTYNWKQWNWTLQCNKMTLSRSDVDLISLTKIYRCSDQHCVINSIYSLLKSCIFRICGLFCMFIKPKAWIMDQDPIILGTVHTHSKKVKPSKAIKYVLLVFLIWIPLVLPVLLPNMNFPGFCLVWLWKPTSVCILLVWHPAHIYL